MEPEYGLLRVNTDKYTEQHRTKHKGKVKSLQAGTQNGVAQAHPKPGAANDHRWAAATGAHGQAMHVAVRVSLSSPQTAHDQAGL